MSQANFSPAHEGVPHSKSSKDSTKASRAPPLDRKDVIVILPLILVSGFLYGWMLVAFAQQVTDVRQPSVHIRVIGVDGLDPLTSPPEPLAFHLAVDADGGVSQGYCSGGGNSMLRVSCHGMVLAWGHVPRFCTGGGRRGDGRVATVLAKAEGTVLREDVRGLVWSEKRKAEFDVEGEVKELGYLRCKAFWFEAKSMEPPKAMCQF
ncbi:hypothetical protein HU200_047341 [Digitaria exilis]|uniref:Uncharacterized protein n=1 Tax=Digitaria exilis TaxID=1010633 RepID=A0A835AUL2_9POAL|nr:hypothetical protein HU200_047341 [Digitaria exilis]